MTRTLIPALATLLLACAPPSGPATPAPVASARPAAPSTAPAARQAAFPCRLPVAFQSDPASPPVGAFLAAPDGKVTTDPSGATAWGTPEENSIVVLDPPRLQGSGGPSYASGAHRWVPAHSAHVAPDGLSYAYAEPKSRPVTPGTQTRIQVVQAATGAARAYETGGSKSPVAFDATGIYVAEGRWEASPRGLWRLDPATGALQALRTDGAWTTVAGGAAWGFLGSTVIGQPIERVDRLDLASGRTEQWLSRPGAYLQVLGTDGGGRAVVQLGTLEPAPGVRIDVAVLEAPGRPQTLFSVPSEAPAVGVLADSHGLWILTTTKVLLLREGGTLQEIASRPSPDRPFVTALTGPCA